MNIIDYPELYRLLGSLDDFNPSQWSDTEAYIWDMFGQKSAVLVTDMASFSQITQEQGIVYYLGMIKKMQDIIAISATRHQGVVIKFSADNAFVLFNEVDQALREGVARDTAFEQLRSSQAHTREVQAVHCLNYARQLAIIPIAYDNSSG